MGKLSSGDPLHNITAQEFNGHVDVSEWYKLQKRLGEGGTSPGSHIPTDRVKAKNNSGSNVPRGGVLEFTSFLLSTDLQQEYPWFNATTPDLTNVGWGVARNPIPIDAIGEMQIAGVAIAIVNVSDATHKYARPAASSRKFASGNSGPVRILYKSAGTGDKECWVHLGSDPTAAALLGKTDASHAKGASGTVSVWTGTPGSESDSTVNVTAYNRFGAVDSGKWVWLSNNGDGWYLVATEC
jgi:hypothetical protein